MTRYLLAVLIGSVALYGLSRAWALIAGPSLSISSPTAYGTYDNGIVPIIGRAPRAASLTVNGASLLRDQTGAFSSTLTFPTGGTILTFVATDRFGRSVTETREIYVPPRAGRTP